MDIKLAESWSNIEDVGYLSVSKSSVQAKHFWSSVQYHHWHKEFLHVLTDFWSKRDWQNAPSRILVLSQSPNSPPGANCVGHVAVKTAAFSTTWNVVVWVQVQTCYFKSAMGTMVSVLLYQKCLHKERVKHKSLERLLIWGVSWRD